LLAYGFVQVKVSSGEISPNEPDPRLLAPGVEIAFRDGRIVRAPIGKQRNDERFAGTKDVATVHARVRPKHRK
jgi:hypothetical protein